MSDPKNKSYIVVSEEELSQVFAEWERRFREKPDEFQSEMNRLANDYKTTGEFQAAYLVKLIAEVLPANSSVEVPE